MKYQDDPDLTRTQAFAVVMFLLAENKRHRKDIENNDKLIDGLDNKFNFTDKELELAMRMGKKYIEI